MKHQYDDAGNLVKTTVHEDGGATVNEIILRTWDKHGNELTVSFDDDANGEPNWQWRHSYECWSL